MKENINHLDTLSDIRSLMEKSSKFISLSGLSGVFAGIFALVGAISAYIYLNIGFSSSNYYDLAYQSNGKVNSSFFTFFFLDGALVLLLALSFGIYFTLRKAKKNNQTFWNSASKRLLINLLIPLISGGLFCLVLLYHGLIGLIAPTTLIFYGLSLINASKYTLDDIRYLGFCQLILGFISSFFIGYGLIFWAIGFGILHILYGIIMYNKYER